MNSSSEDRWASLPRWKGEEMEDKAEVECQERRSLLGMEFMPWTDVSRDFLGVELLHTMHAMYIYKHVHQRQPHMVHNTSSDHYNFTIFPCSSSTPLCVH